MLPVLCASEKQGVPGLLKGLQNPLGEVAQDVKLPVSMPSAGLPNPLGIGSWSVGGTKGA